MKIAVLRCAIAVFLVAPLAAIGGAAENVLSVFWEEVQRVGSPDAPPIALTAEVKAKASSFVLSFRLTNISDRSIVLLDAHLPWANANSLILAAQTLDGRQIQNYYPIDDQFIVHDVSIAPGQSLKGEYDLTNRFVVEKISRNRGILVLWAYPLIEKSRKRPWPIVTGVAVVPPRK